MSSCDCYNSLFGVETRIQFTVITENVDCICTILTKIGGLGINVTAYNLIYNNRNQIVFRFIVGTATVQPSCFLETVRSVISKYCYTEKEVIRVSILNSRIPGLFALAVCTVSQNAGIYYSYVTENGNQIFETTNNEKAMQALSGLCSN
ncbi:MAG: hypothetical protein ACRDA3_06925 [Peptostreptococcaceae bacterium]